MLHAFVSFVQSKNAALAILCLALLAGYLATPAKAPPLDPIRPIQVLDDLANAGKCDEAIKSYDNFKKEYSDQPFEIAAFTTDWDIGGRNHSRGRMVFEYQ